EISDVSEDGRTLFYTDAAGQRVGILDISDPAAPVGRGTLDLTRFFDAGTPVQPTSVAVVGDHLLAVVDTSESFTEASGALLVVRISDGSLQASIDLGGQPDSIAISKDGAWAAIAMENQRDEDANGANLPQAPAGFLQTVALTGDPSTWETRPVPFTNADGSALPAFTAAGIDTPVDPEPEYVTINADDKVAVTLQENNGIVVVDLPTGTIENVFSAGNAQVSGIDTTSDGVFNPTGSLDKPREPDAIAWVGDDLVATANEGDWKGGTRGWTVFDTTTGDVVWDAGNSFEQLATRHGLFIDSRAKASSKGTEPEGLAFAEVGGTPYAFVGSERSNFVAVYDMTDPREPVFRQVLPATNGPEGILPIPGRDLLAVTSETDDAAVGVRASVSLYELGADTPFFPSIASADVPGSDPAQPIGWGALSALSAHPTDPDTLYAASDSAFKPGRVYTVDVSGSPAVISSVVDVTNASGTPQNLDIEGLAARPEGGFWLANEGATGPANSLVRIDAAGVVQETVPLPTDVTTGLRNWGLEGVSIAQGFANETLYVALQRPLGTGVAGATPEDTTRIGRYDTVTGEWTWFGYTLEPTSTAGDWVGLSEIVTVDDDTVAVIERDKLNGPRAAIKRVYTVDLPAGTPGTVTPVEKELAVDVLPALTEQHGWTQEKLEGLTIAADGEVYAVTDNDGLKDATGETQFLRLGRALDSELATTTTTLATRQTAPGAVRLSATVTGGTAAGTVQFLEGDTVVGTAPVASGAASVDLTGVALGPHSYVARFVPAVSSGLAESTSPAGELVVTTTTTTTLAAADLNRDVATLTVTVAPAATTPVTGRVVVLRGETEVASAPLVDGTATLEAALTPGTHPLTATYLPAEDSLATSSSSTSTDVTVLTSSSTLLTAVSAGAGRAQLRAVVTPRADSPVVGNVAFFEGVELVGVGPVVDGQATADLEGVAGGAHAYTAMYVPDPESFVASSTSSEVELGVGAVTSLYVGATPVVAPYGRTRTVGVKVTGGAPVDGVAQVHVGGIRFAVPLVDGVGRITIPSGLAVGTHTALAVFAGDATHGASSSTIDLVVRATPTRIDEALPTTISAGRSVTSSFYVTAPGSQVPARGAIRIYHGGRHLTTAEVRNGRATVTLPALAARTYDLRAVFDGGASFGRSQLDFRTVAR
ncbi:MAG TPA: esterase-like activity of phytase family protein, partial [Nocardioides sp.]